VLAEHGAKTYRVIDGARWTWRAFVAKRLADAHRPKLARWHKILNSQRRGRAGWFPSFATRHAIHPFEV
jgi:hypothetical protein